MNFAGSNGIGSASISKIHFGNRECFHFLYLTHLGPKPCQATDYFDQNNLIGLFWSDGKYKLAHT